MVTDGGPAHVRPGLAELLLVLGGAAAAAGSFLEWFRIRVGLRGLALVARTVTEKGIDGSDGKVTLVAGLVAVLMGLLMFMWNSGGQRVAMGIVALLAGLAAAGLSGFDAATPRQRFIDANARDLARRTHIPLATVKRLCEGLFRSGAVRISLGFGIFVVVAGGAIAALAAAVALGKSPEAPVDDAASEPMAAPPEQTG